MDRFNIYVVEDMAVSRQALELKLLKNNHLIAGSSASAEQAWNEIKVNAEIDLVLIDIHLAGEKDGIWLAQQIRSSLDLPFVFLTAFGDDRTLEKVADTKPDGYLMKPYQDSTLRATISIAVNKKRNQVSNSSGKEVLELKEGYETVYLAPDKIHYMQSDGNYVHFFLDGKSHLIRGKLDSFLEDLNPNVFLKVHQRYVVNRHKITKLGIDHLFVLDTEIPISRRLRKNLPGTLKR